MASTLSQMIKRRPLPAFFGLAYLLSWCAVPWAGPQLLPWGPALAAVIILAMTEGRAGLKDLASQMGRWRVGFTWYAVAISLPIIYGLSATGLNLLFGATMGELDPWNNLLLLIPLFLLLGGQWEEPGWTGYALPRLQVGRSAIAASLILSVLRLGWHLPLFFYGAITWADTVFIIAMQFVVTWLYNSTRGSAFIIIVLHLMQNVSGGFFNPAFSGDDAVGYAWLRAALYAVVAIGLVVWTGAALVTKTRGTTPPPDPSVRRGVSAAPPGIRRNRRIQ
jgi:uncharacterized protein